MGAVGRSAFVGRTAFAGFVVVACTVSPREVPFEATVAEGGATLQLEPSWSPSGILPRVCVLPMGEGASVDRLTARATGRGVDIDLVWSSGTLLRRGASWLCLDPQTERARQELLRGGGVSKIVLEASPELRIKSVLLVNGDKG